MSYLLLLSPTLPGSGGRVEHIKVGEVGDVLPPPTIPYFAWQWRQGGTYKSALRPAIPYPICSSNSRSSRSSSNLLPPGVSAMLLPWPPILKTS